MKVLLFVSILLLTGCGGGGDDILGKPLPEPTPSVDTDGDGIGNPADQDDDNDGVADKSDAFPLDSSETLDTDSDGIGNNTDADDDDDGVLDVNDLYPLDARYSNVVETGIAQSLPTADVNIAQTNATYTSGYHERINLDVTNPYDDTSHPSDLFIAAANLTNKVAIGADGQYILSYLTYDERNDQFLPYNRISSLDTDLDTVYFMDLIRLASTASAVTNFYKGDKIKVTRYDSEGNPYNQTGTIVAYDGPNKLAKVDSHFQPDYRPQAGDTYTIIFAIDDNADTSL